MPRELEAICRKAMAREPEQRYPTARALADDLRAYRLGLPGDAWTDPTPRRPIKVVRRHPTASAVVVALSLVHEQLRRYEQSVHSILGLLAGWGIVLDGSALASVLADRIRGDEPRVRADLLDTLFLLAQHLGRVEIARYALLANAPDIDSEEESESTSEEMGSVAWPEV